MRLLFLAVFICITTGAFSQQIGDKPPKSMIKTAEDKAKEAARKAPIAWYKIYSVEKDTVIADTSLTLQRYYQYNYLRKDRFGHLQYPNEGQVFNLLDYTQAKSSVFPAMGYQAKHYAFLEAEDIRYYHVPTPYSDIYFKTVMEQGQNVDALVALNTSKNFNISIAFKGLRSLGRYTNQLASTGNFRLTSSYKTTSGRYAINFHYTGQDFLNGENGGLANPAEFESGEAIFNNRARLQVMLTDAQSVLKSKRFFFDHAFRVNPNDSQNNLSVFHRFNYEHKFFEFNQKTLATTVDGVTFNRFGDAVVNANINDHTNYDKFYNRAGIAYENKSLGTVRFYIEHFFNRFGFQSERTVNTLVIPRKRDVNVATLGGVYEYRKGNWRGTATLANALGTETVRYAEAKAAYTFNARTHVNFQYTNQSKLPNNNFLLHQSSYEAYNWVNNFRNEKYNAFQFEAQTPWLNASVQWSNSTDKLFFTDVQNVANQQLVTPQQFSGSINYLAVKVAREFRYKRFGLDATVLYQNVTQSQAILNLPEFTARGSLYYQDHWFKKAMFIQTGATVNYFTSYFVDDYNPVLGEFFVQTQKKIGDFPVVDVFFNARVRQTRIFLIAEHVNGLLRNNDFYASPSMPYRDFIIRFGLVWNFFQ